MKYQPPRSTTAAPAHLDQLQPPIRGLILDMDGVLWKEDEPIGDLPAIFGAIKDRGLSVVAATNNATKTVDEYLAKLRGFGVSLEPWQIVTAAEATALTLAHDFPARGRPPANSAAMRPSLRTMARLTSAMITNSRCGNWRLKWGWQSALSQRFAFVRCPRMIRVNAVPT